MLNADEFHDRYHPRSIYQRNFGKERWYQCDVHSNRPVVVGDRVEILVGDGKVVDYGVVDSATEDGWFHVIDPTTVTIMEESCLN